MGTYVGEWIEENLCGYLADSTMKQYAGVYYKWKAWSARQGWPTEFLEAAGLPRVPGMAGMLGRHAEAGRLRDQGWAQKRGSRRLYGEDASPVDAAGGSGKKDRQRSQGAWE